MKTAIQEALEIIEKAREGEIDNDLRSIRHRIEQLLEKERADHKFSYEQGRIDFSCELDNGSDEIESPSFKNFEDYFTQTYKQ